MWINNWTSTLDTPNRFEMKWKKNVKRRSNRKWGLPLFIPERCAIFHLSISRKLPLWVSMFLLKTFPGIGKNFIYQTRFEQKRHISPHKFQLKLENWKFKTVPCIIGEYIPYRTKTNFSKFLFLNISFIFKKKWRRGDFFDRENGKKKVKSKLLHYHQSSPIKPNYNSTINLAVYF